MDTSVLIIDDSPTARQGILDVLRQTALFNHYYEAGDGIEGFKTLLNRPVDVILCDLEMPGLDGLKFLGILGGREELQDIPVIMLTGCQDREAKLRGLEQGASDYVTKPFDPEELVARVKVQLKIKSLQDSLKQSNRRLLELSNTDTLTGLCNRRNLMEILALEIERSTRKNLSLALVMVDLDRFKKVNDTYGHQQGDAVLVTVAGLLRDALRQYDVAARFGGEEFVLILPATDLAQAAEVAERIRAAAAAITFAGPLKELRLTLSLGVAAFPHDRIRALDDLVREADYALYNAKRGGRDRVAVMEP